MLKLIKTTVLDASAASVTISNIPQEFKTLQLCWTGRGDNNNTYCNVNMTFNSSNGTTRYVFGNGSTTGSGTDTVMFGGYIPLAQYTASTFGNSVVTIPNYSTSANKPSSVSTVIENNATTSIQMLNANLWSNSAAVTSITLTPALGNFVAGSSFYLYGVA